MGIATYDFTNERVLVTGSSRGIGYAIADAFHDAKAEVILLADDASVHDAAARLGKTGGRAPNAIQCDITDQASVSDAIADIDRIDVLVNNAGLERITPLGENLADVDKTFRRITDININGTFFMTRAALEKMRRGGRIIFTGSVWSRSAVAEFSAYVASKHATLGLMRSLAHELAPRGINVNAVCPGWVRTDASMLTLRRMAERSGRSEEDLLSDIVGAQLIHGLMEPSDIAPTYLFLASDAARNITGQAINVDRGELMP